MGMDVHPECTLKERKGQGGGANILSFREVKVDSKISLTMVKFLLLSKLNSLKKRKCKKGQEGSGNEVKAGR